MSTALGNIVTSLCKLNNQGVGEVGKHEKEDSENMLVYQSMFFPLRT